MFIFEQYCLIVFFFKRQKVRRNIFWIFWQYKPYAYYLHMHINNNRLVNTHNYVTKLNFNDFTIMFIARTHYLSIYLFLYWCIVETWVLVLSLTNLCLILFNPVITNFFSDKPANKLLILGLCLGAVIILLVILLVWCHFRGKARV